MSIRARLPILVGSLAMLAALGVAGWRQVNPPWTQYRGTGEVILITPTLTERPEMCLTCHDGIEVISDSHPVDAFGCVICHGGDRLSLDLETAHSSLIGTEADRGSSADLSVVETTCGGADCHSGNEAAGRDHVARVTRSLHATYAGGIQQTVAALGKDGGPYGIIAAADDSVQHPAGVESLVMLTPGSPGGMTDLSGFLQECTGCHVAPGGTAAAEPYRGAGCSACHVYYAGDGLYQGGDPTIPRTESGHPATHQMSTVIPGATCNRCHNQGTYDLEAMTFERQSPGRGPYLVGSTHYAICQYTLDCIDCHTASEVMGDGDIYLAQADALRVQCRTCHGTLEDPAATVVLEDPDDPAFRRAQLNPYYDVFVGNTVVLAPGGDAMEHIRFEDGLYSIVSKTTGRPYLVPQVAGTACEQSIDRQLAIDCQECHTYDPANPD